MSLIQFPLSDLNVCIKTRDLGHLSSNTIACYPKEACSILLGTISNDIFKIEEIFFIKNNKKSFSRFIISQCEVELAIKKSKFKLIGIYHSHHNNTVPSIMDSREMAKKEILWLIGCCKTQNSFVQKFMIDAYIKINNLIQKLKIKIL